VVNSILTNYNSLVALQNLQATQQMLAQTQNQISTGLKVSSAKDDAATWAISTAMKSNISNLQQTSANLSQSDSVVGTAVSATNTIASLLTKISTAVTSAESPTASTSLTSIQNNIKSYIAQIQSTIDGSSVNGVNLLNSSGSTQFLASVNANANGTTTPTYINLAQQNLATTGSGALAALSSLSVQDVGSTVLANVTDSNQAVTYAPTVAAGQVQFAYTDANGKAQSIGVTTTAATQANLVQQLNANSTFSSLFTATATANYTAASLGVIANGATATFSYTDSGGVSHSVTTGNTGAATVANLITTLNNTAGFSNYFTASSDGSAGINIDANNAGIAAGLTAGALGGAAVNGGTAVNVTPNSGATLNGSITIEAKTRAIGASNTIGALSGAGVGGGTVTGTTSTTLNFQDNEPLSLGQQFALTYNTNTAAVAGSTADQKTVILQVANDASGTSLGTNSNGDQIIAVNSAVVTAFNATGAQIAGEFKTALLGSGGSGNTSLETIAGTSDFDNAAGVANRLGVAVATGSAGAGAGNSALVISATGAGTQLVSLTPPATNYSTLLNTVNTATNTVTTYGAQLGSAQNQIEGQKTFVDSLTSTLQNAVSNMIDADMSSESARLTALQVQQQLGTQALSIANQAPQNILSLFK